MDAHRALYGGQLPPLRRRLQELRRPARQRRSRRHEPRRQGGGRRQREEWGPCPLRERGRPRGTGRIRTDRQPLRHRRTGRFHLRCALYARRRTWAQGESAARNGRLQHHRRLGRGADTGHRGVPGAAISAARRIFLMAAAVLIALANAILYSLIGNNTFSNLFDFHLDPWYLSAVYVLCGFFARYGLMVLAICMGGAALAILLTTVTFLFDDAAYVPRGVAETAYTFVLVTIGGATLGAIEGVILAFPLAWLLDLIGDRN